MKWQQLQIWRLTSQTDKYANSANSKRKSPGNLVPPNMMKKTVAHVQTTPRFVLQLMHSFISYNFHFSKSIPNRKQLKNNKQNTNKKLDS